MRSGVGSVDAVRADVVGRLRARRGELVEAIFRRVRAGAFAGVGDGDAEYLAGLRAAVAAGVEYSLRGIECGVEWAGPIPVAAVEQARRAARVGVSLDTVLRRYVVGSALLEEVVLEEADRGERGVLRGALGAQALVLDRLLAAVTVEYGDELARAGRSPEQRRLERVKGLLAGSVDERSELGYDLRGWHLGVIALGAGAEDAVRELAARVDRRLLSVAQGGRSVWGWPGGRERLAWGEVERASAGVGGGVGGMRSHPVDGVVLAFGESGRGIEGWRLTHRQAQAALLVALRRPGLSGVTRYADVALLATALKDETLARALVEVYLLPLEDARNGGPVLRETLHAYVAAERNASSAAVVLGVARSTVESRLRLIEGRLGRSLHRCPAELEVALGLDELGVWSGERFER